MVAAPPTRNPVVELIEHLGGFADPAAPPSASQLVALLRKELARGLGQVGLPRAGYDRPLVVPFAAASGQLAAVIPVPARLRNDAGLLDGQSRPLLIVAAALESLLLMADQRPVVPGRSGLVAQYGAWEGALVIAVSWPRSSGPDAADAELAALGFDEQLASADRLRTVGVGLPAGAARIVLTGLEFDEANGHRHPLDVIEVLVRAGVEPAAAVASLTDAASAYRVLLDATLGAAVAGHRPHEDPDPARRIARRMLQMLMGKRKWSGGTGAGYHTEVTHLTRGFEARDRELAGKVVDALLDAGLLVEKTSVGQRHVSLLSRRAADITALVDDGTVPPDLELPAA